MFGAGTIGIAAAIALRYFGCKQVMVCDHSDFRLKKAKDLGFAVCNNGKEDLRQAAIGEFGKAFSALGKTADVDIYIDAVGTDGTPAVPALQQCSRGKAISAKTAGQSFLQARPSVRSAVPRWRIAVLAKIAATDLNGQVNSAPNVEKNAKNNEYQERCCVRCSF